MSAGWVGIRSSLYARRKGKRIEEVERWLGSSLAYDPAAAVVQTT